MRSFATPGGNGLPPEFHKRRVLAPIRLRLANLRSARLRRGPDDQLRTILIPLHKNGAMDDPNKYRGIALLSAAAKLFDEMLLNTLHCGYSARIERLDAEHA